MDLLVLVRGRIRADLNFAPDGAVAATHSDSDPALECAEFAIRNLLVDHPEATVLRDTGSHPEAADGYWPDGANSKAPTSRRTRPPAATTTWPATSTATSTDGWTTGRATTCWTALTSSTCPNTLPAVWAHTSTGTGPTIT